MKEKNIVVHRLEILSGGFREEPRLLCAIDQTPLDYGKDKFIYTGDEGKGHRYIADVCAYRCQCGMQYLLSDVSNEINLKLRGKRIELGMV